LPCLLTLSLGSLLYAPFCLRSATACLGFFAAPFCYRLLPPGSLVHHHACTLRACRRHARLRDAAGSLHSPHTLPLHTCTTAISVFFTGFLLHSALSSLLLRYHTACPAFCAYALPLLLHRTPTSLTLPTCSATCTSCWSSGWVAALQTLPPARSLPHQFCLIPALLVYSICARSVVWFSTSPTAHHGFATTTTCTACLHLARRCAYVRIITQA